MNTKTPTPTTPDLRAFIYCRVSTDEQARKGYGLDVQEEQCREYASRAGLVVAGVFKDDYTGTTLERPAMGEMRRALTAGRAGTVIAHRSNRVSRDDVDYLVFLRDMSRAGIALHLQDRGVIRHERGAGKFINYLDGWQGNEDNDQRTKATKNGRRAKASAGHWVGNGGVPFGYQRHGKREEACLSIDDVAASTVRRVFELYTGHGGQRPMPLQGIAELLTSECVPTAYGGHNWRVKVVRDLLDRTAYIGEFKYADITIQLPDLAIIDRATFERAARQRQANKERSSRNARRHYLLAGHFRCACGANMSAYAATNAHSYYACMHQRKDRHLRRCDKKQIAVAKADRLVWDWLRELLKDDAAIDAGIDRMAQRADIELSGKRERLATVEELLGQVDGDLADYAADLRGIKSEAARSAIRKQMDDLATRREALERERGDLQGELSQGQISAEERAEIKRIAAEIRAGLDEADFDDIRFILGRLNVRALHRIDDSGEWLDVRCEFTGEGAIGLHVS